MSGVLKLGSTTFGTENNGKIDLTNVGPTQFSSSHHTWELKAVDAPIVGANYSTNDDPLSGQLAIYNGATKLWGITESGYQTNPNMPLFSCGSPINSASATGVLKNLYVFHNPGNHYNSSTGLYTAPISGYYLIYHWFMNSSSGTMDVYSIYNGVRDQVGTTYGGNNSQFAHASGSYIRYLSAGDAIGLETAQTVYHSTDGRHGAFGAILVG